MNLEIIEPAEARRRKYDGFERMKTLERWKRCAAWAATQPRGEKARRRAANKRARLARRVNR